MPISLPSGFKITTTEPIDDRLVMTKAQMKAIKKPQMPSMYFTLCSDDGQIYVYDKTIESSAETGYFRPANAELIGDIDDLQAAVEALNRALENKQDELHPGDGIIMEQDSEGQWIIKSEVTEEMIAEKIPDALKEALQSQSEASGLDVDSEGNIHVLLDENYLEFDNSNRITFADFTIECSL